MYFLAEFTRKPKEVVMDNLVYSDGFLSVSYREDNRRVSDSFFYENEKYVIVNIGVLYTQYAEFDKDTKKQQIFNYICNLYEKYGKGFPKELRGAFCGILYSKAEHELIVYTDHVTNRRAFWYYDKNIFLASSDLVVLSEKMCKSGIKPKLFEPAAYMMCSYGCMLYDATLIENAKKLLPGSVLYTSDKNSSPMIDAYYDLNQIEESNMSIDKSMEMMEDTFSNAIRNEFNRDLASQTKHLITLSGGLDSRAVRLVAHDMGYDNVWNITMSQTRYQDELIAEKISSDMADDYTFIALDNGMFLLNGIKNTLKNNGATIIYQGNAHMDKLMDSINFESVGLLHTGMIGDAVMGGSFVRNSNNNTPYMESGVYSKKVVEYLTEYFESIKNNYKNNEMFLMYNRGINGAFNGLYSTQRKIEAVSPFIDPDVLELNLKVPRDYRKDSKLYIMWMEKYHPNMLKYVWEKTSCKPNANKMIIEFIRVIKGINRRINISNKLSMNPYDYWYKSNITFKNGIDKEVKNAIELLDSYPNILNNCKSILMNGNVSEKMQFISLAYAMKVLNII